MKICFISNSVTLATGFGQQVAFLGKELANRGHEIFNLCERRLNKKIDWISEISFNSINLEAMDRELERIEPDVVICLHGYPMSFVFPSLSYSGRCKFFIWFPYESIVALREHKPRLKNVPDSNLVFVSEFSKKIWDRDCEVIPHCVDSEFLSTPNVENGKRLRMKFGISSRNVLVNVNRNEIRKRWDKFFEVAKYLTENPKEIFDTEDRVEILIHSNKEGGYYDFTELADYHGLADRVHYTDFDFANGLSREDFRDLMSSIDVRLDTSSSEGFGMTVAEFAAMGIRQYVGDHTCMSEILGNDYPKFPVSGLYVAPSNNIYSEIDYSRFERPTFEHVRASELHVKTNFSVKRIADLWLDKIDKTEINGELKWGFNGTELNGAKVLAAAHFCVLVGGEVKELEVHNDKFISSCLYHGLSVSGAPAEKNYLSDRIKYYCKESSKQANIVVVNDTLADTSNVRSLWLLVSDQFETQPVPSIYHRRYELESAMIAKNPSFKHKIYCLNPDINPFK